jgi:prolyl-tRNA editing enzyme YbaK/EbsC (Cys-tRNA(Pro) deacylase)
MKQLKRSAETVQQALAGAGMDLEVVELPASTRSAKEAAMAVGCEVDQIAKSIVFRTIQSNRAVMVVARGSRRVDEGRVATAVGESIEKATPDFVRGATGYAIGGVPPCGHLNPVLVLLDEGLRDLETLWAAAGTPNAVFSLTPEQLVELTGGRLLKVVVPS